MNIIGLGNAGCQVANNFNEWPQYNILCIDVENKGYKKYMPVEEQATHEEYEQNFKNLKIKKLAGPTTIFLCGAGAISGMCLRLLQTLKDDKQLTIFYIKPDLDSLSKHQRTRHKITFGVLQQYVRSDAIARMYVVDNKSIETLVEDISIADYWKNINYAVSNTYHMINFFENTEPLLSTFSPVSKTSKIASFSVVNFDTFNEKPFYQLDKPRFRRYFFGVNEKTMQQEKELLHRIRDFTKERTNENTHASFSIYSTDYEHNYVYSVQYASMIQEENIS